MKYLLSFLFGKLLLLSHLALAQQFSNPVLWEDTPDIDIIRVDNTYYYSASSFHLSPGAPILRSYDLVNWEYAGHSVPVLDWSSQYSLTGSRAYVKGIWASFFNYRKSDKTFYWGGCIQSEGKTFIYTATKVEGPWSKRGTINGCYYDAGLLIDDDDNLYVAFGNTKLSVAQLSRDGSSQVRVQEVYSASFTLEGARMYKRNGAYYIFVTRPADGQFVLKSTNGPFGPYTLRTVLDRLSGPISGGGVPHQGGLVDTPNGQWYYMAFIDAYPGGRVPALAPITWTSDGWPQLQLVNNAWGQTYTKPNLPGPFPSIKSPLGTDTFPGPTLDHKWEWNHNPDNSKWSFNNGLRLSTATVTVDLYSARNTLTHRTRGPSSTATIVLDYSQIADGDRTGLALFRDQSAWVGVVRNGNTVEVAVVKGIDMDSKWTTSATGSYAARSSIPAQGKIWLRASIDIRPGNGRVGKFSYSRDGNNWTSIGGDFTLKNAWQFFLGYRFGIFNYATSNLGGSVTVQSFTISSP